MDEEERSGSRGPAAEGLGQRRLGEAVLLLSVAIGCLWLLDVLGRGLPSTVDRGVVLLWLASVAVWFGYWTILRWRRGRERGSSWNGLLLPGLLLLALLVRLVGIDWEAGTGYYRDEGIYREAAQTINDGDLLPRSFIYGHLPYYVLAVTLWLHSLFSGAVGLLARGLFDASNELQELWVTLRATSAVYGAVTVLPVYLTARRAACRDTDCNADRVAGRAAGTVAALLIVFSPLYNEITHLVISDVPAAFFATLCLPFVARLLDREHAGDYLWAGACAGLAAASKYPAGVVAVAIVAAWLRWRIRERRWSFGILWAGLAAVATLLAVMPALLAFPDIAFAGGGKDIFFGARQYGRRGWVGVIKESNFLWYAEQLLTTFRGPALVVGLSGIFALPRRVRSRLLWLAPYPVAYLLLLVAMNMVVRRNLLPVLPAIAVVLGVGSWGWIRLLGQRPRRLERALAWVLGIAIVALPLLATVQQDLAMSRPSTHEVAVAWIRGNLPRGARLVKEAYTPRLNPREYAWRQSRFAARLSLEEIRDPANDYLLLAWNAYGRFLDEEHLTKPHHRVYAERYRQIFEWDMVREFDPGRTRFGPYLRLYRLDPETITYREARRFEAAAAAFASPPAFAESIASDERDGVAFYEAGQYVLFKDYFTAGRYLATLDGAIGAKGSLRIRTRDNREIGVERVGSEASAIRLPAPGKYFFYLELEPGARLMAFELHRVGP